MEHRKSHERREEESHADQSGKLEEAEEEIRGLMEEMTDEQVVEFLVEIEAEVERREGEGRRGEGSSRS